MIKAIIFDFDGVLVESVGIKTKAFAELFAQEAAEDIKDIVGYHLRHPGISRFDKFRSIYKNILCRKLTQNEFRLLCRKFTKLVKEGVINAKFVKGAQEFLKIYSDEYKCFIVSATPQKELRDIIRRRGMQGYFAGVYGAPKKKTGSIKTIIRKYGLSHKEIIYIGDAISDYEAASANFVRFIAKIDNNESVFTGVNCLKIRNLKSLGGILNKLCP